MINYCYLQSVRPRIPFASAVINAACSALRSNYVGLGAVSLVFMFLQLLWLLMSSAALYFAVHFYQLRNQGYCNLDIYTVKCMYVCTVCMYVCMWFT